MLQEKFSQYIEAVLANRLEKSGFALNDVVATVVVLEWMIFADGIAMLDSLSNRSELVDVASALCLPGGSGLTLEIGRTFRPP